MPLHKQRIFLKTDLEGRGGLNISQLVCVDCDFSLRELDTLNLNSNSQTCIKKKTQGLHEEQASTSRGRKKSNALPLHAHEFHNKICSAHLRVRPKRNKMRIAAIFFREIRWRRLRKGDGGGKCKKRSLISDKIRPVVVMSFERRATTELFVEASAMRGRSRPHWPRCHGLQGCPIAGKKIPPARENSVENLRCFSVGFTEGPAYDGTRQRVALGKNNLNLKNLT